MTKSAQSGTRRRRPMHSVGWALMLLQLLQCGSRVAGDASASDAPVYCSTHLYPDASTSNEMQFTKEVVSHEYTTANEYKSLHCCAKGYQSIEWFMNGKPTLGTVDTSSLVLDPRAENQTIHSFGIKHSDAGNYTCVLRNATHKREHRIELHVQGDSPDTPLPTFRPRDISVDLHQSVRLFCEAFVGHVMLPDAHTVVTWSQVFDGELTPLPDDVQETVQREGTQIVGSYLRIAHMQTHNYGRYLCRIDGGNAANRLEMAVQISGPPTVASDLYWSMTPLQLALSAALLTVGLLVVLRYTLAWYRLWRKRELNHCLARNGSGGLSGLLVGRCGAAGGVAGNNNTADGMRPTANDEKLMSFRNIV